MKSKEGGVGSEEYIFKSGKLESGVWRGEGAVWRGEGAVEEWGAVVRIVEWRVGGESYIEWGVKNEIP